MITTSPLRSLRTRLSRAAQAFREASPPQSPRVETADTPDVRRVRVKDGGRVLPSEPAASPTRPTINLYAARQS
jgi:hypothetical protein